MVTKPDIKCDICEKTYNNNTDTSIQRNLQTGKMVCINCAWKEFEGRVGKEKPKEKIIRKSTGSNKLKEDLIRVMHHLDHMDCNKDRDSEDYTRVGLMINIIGKHLKNI